MTLFERLRAFWWQAGRAMPLLCQVPEAPSCATPGAAGCGKAENTDSLIEKFEAIADAHLRREQSIISEQQLSHLQLLVAL